MAANEWLKSLGIDKNIEISKKYQVLST